MGRIVRKVLFVFSFTYFQFNYGIYQTCRKSTCSNVKKKNPHKLLPELTDVNVFVIFAVV